MFSFVQGVPFEKSQNEMAVALKRYIFNQGMSQYFFKVPNTNIP